jgi:hypothetical protein
LAFYEWPKWIEDKMIKIIFASRYGQTKSTAASAKIQQASEEVKIKLQGIIAF